MRQTARLSAATFLVFALGGCGGGGSEGKPEAPDQAERERIQAAFLGVGTACLAPDLDEAAIERHVDVLIEEFRESPDVAFKANPKAKTFTMRQTLQESRESLRVCSEAGLSTRASALVDRINTALDAAEPAAEGDGEAAPAPPPPPPPAVPTPDGTFTGNCSYVLGDFSESASGYRFIADATLRNTGNIGIVARVTATWNQSGSGPIREVKTVKVPYRRNKVVHFTRIASQDEIDLHQAAATGDATGKTCNVDVKIADTFGRAQASG